MQGSAPGYSERPVPTLYLPDAVFADGRLDVGGALAVGDDGNVLQHPPRDAEVVRLPGRLLMPGLVNTHSFAFHRVLRGRGEHRLPQGAPDGARAWEDALGAAVAALDPEGVYAASKQAFLEMALAGVTAVGEFHCLHHQPNGAQYADVHTLARQVVLAAREVGLRIALLRVAWARAGWKKNADPRQARCYELTPDKYLERTADLRAHFQPDPLVSVGVALHSVRTVPRPWLERVAQAAPAELQGAVVHARTAASLEEVDACQAEHGMRPVELLDDVGLLRRGTTLVHAVHLSKSELDRVAKSQAGVCACPSTDRGRGFGVVPADALLQAGVPISLGTGSHAQVDLLEEARLLEGHLRLLHRRRAVLDDGGGAPDALARRLWDCASVEGARALGLPTGTLAPGTPADFLTLDLGHPTLAGWRPATLLTQAVFAATPGCVREVAVQGRLIVRDGHHPQAEATVRDFSKLAGA